MVEMRQVEEIPEKCINARFQIQIHSPDVVLGNAELDQRGLLNFYVNCSSIESTVVVTESLLLPMAMMHKAQ